jgi:predicted dehydrogenase|tara:strand:- start:9796 stop:10938 length:1143 start_codon:yes stop_codon:yes gene_type:complete
MERIRLGMVGGGEGAFIGEVHRMASRLDDRYTLCAGALCSDAKKAASSALSIGISQERSYSTYQEMASTESDLVAGIEVVAIVTPNHLHYPIAKEFLLAGIHVICDKPMTIDTQEARELIDLAKTSNLMLAVTYNYSAYPMIRHARMMIQSGELGELRVVHTKYTQDWLTEPLENTNHKQAHWRVDPKKSGVGGCVGDIGTHAYHLSCFVTKLKAISLCADLSSFVDGRRLDDNAHIMIRYEGNTKGMIWSSQVAPGNGNNLEIQIYGDKGGLVWRQEQPNELIFTPINKPGQTLLRGSAGLSENANALSRVPVGHPEGYIEGFANLYREIADALMIYRSGKKPSSGDILFPTGEDGYDGVSFVEAAVKSNNKGSVWVSL